MDHSIELWADLFSFSSRAGATEGGCSPFPECLRDPFETEDAMMTFWVSEWDLQDLVAPSGGKVRATAGLS